MINKSQEDLACRTRRFALAIVRLYAALPRSTLSFVLGRQLLAFGTSVGAHYREARRAKSDAAFISKMEGVLRDLHETGYWLELLQDACIAKSAAVETLLAESQELIAIFATVVRKMKSELYSVA